MSELPRSAFRFDPELVRAFVQDRLDDAGRAALADEVARLLPFHRQLPHPVIADLVAVTGHLGGDEALLRWLDGYAGRPRVTARLFRVINLLDRWSAVPGVVLARSSACSSLHSPWWAARSGLKIGAGRPQTPSLLDPCEVVF
jgi:hypothetical protein